MRVRGWLLVLSLSGGLMGAWPSSTAAAERIAGTAEVGERVKPADETDADGVCAEVRGHLPPTVVVDPRMDDHVRKMLARSPEFRRQCLALADRPQVYVRVHLVLFGLPPGVHAQSQVTRTHEGPLFAKVQIGLTANWSEWIGHEFEHILEQAEGMTLTDYRGGDGRWESAPDAFETARAIAAGRTIRNQWLQRGDTANE